MVTMLATRLCRSVSALVAKSPEFRRILACSQKLLSVSPLSVNFHHFGSAERGSRTRDNSITMNMCSVNTNMPLGYAAPKRLYTSDSSNGDEESAPIQRFDVEGAEAEVRRKLETKSLRNLYVAHGQYFQHATDERFKVFNSSMPLYGASDDDSFELETLLDCSMLSSQHQDFIDTLKRYSDSPVGVGEVDFINTGEWQCGFCFDPSFSIFTENSKLLTTFTRDVERKSYMRLYAYGLYDDFAVDEIKSVRVKLSEEPWCEQRLEIVLKDDETITILEKAFHETSDMSLLMVETEWAVKCAGLLCLDIKRKGGNMILELPDNLTVAGNPWVEMRHQAWVKSLPPSNSS